MQSFKINKLTMALFLIGVLSTTFFVQNTSVRRKVSLFSLTDKYVIQDMPNSIPTGANKQYPISTNLLTEEEDKIIEEIEGICPPQSPILISLLFSFSHQIFDEPLLKVMALPPWA